ncbi:MAG TPA: AAA family ATPase [bacterium]|nr:AAA family ATPase [bacterium]
MAIKIKSLKIRNFRCIGELDLDFTDPDGNPLDLVVLAGPNGCGKTSVLEVIKILLDWGESEDYAEQINDKELFDEAEPFSPARQADVRQGAKQYQLIFEMNDDDHTGRIEINGPHCDPDAPGFPYNAQHNQVLPNGDWGDRIMRVPFGYFSSRRRQKLVPSLPISDNGRDKEVKAEETNRLFALQRKCTSLWVHTFFDSPEPASHPRVRAIIDPLERIWEIFYPGTEARFIVRPVDKNDPGKDVNLYLRREDGAEIPVNDLSSGEIEVLAMAGWFTMHDYKGGIVLIDEPELHMHEEWHCAIMRALRVLLPETQIIVATHSRDIIDSVMSYEQFWLLHEGDPRLGPNDKPVIRDRPEQDA